MSLVQAKEMSDDMPNKLGLLQINPTCCRACLNGRS